ncbi:XK-related protein 6-like [Orbicella faveolata]|uniref:XK-related protein 6-like n=1 Tax=Orbicella faveolata TaxID=48498 RepID=UPI0009E55715|nr:XK-related protein 6-like [Orbicella faveolata]
MDEQHPKLSRSRLNLDDKQKQTVRALRRQLSTHSTSGSTTEGDRVAELTEEEVLLLRKVVQTLTTVSADSDSIRDNVDGRRVDRNWSVESFLSSSRGSTTYVNPARFYVRVKKEEVKAVEQVCLELDDEELNTKPATNGYGHLNSKNSSLRNYKHYYGYSVAVTQQTLPSERPIVVTTNETVTEALPEDEIKFLSKGRTKYTSHTSKLRHLPPRERFKQAVYLVMGNLKMRPRKMDKDFSELWRKRGNATWLGVFFSVVAIGAFLADIGTDLKVAADHYTAGSNWWASFTVMFVLLPSVVTNLFSFFWYKEDDEQVGRRPKSGWRTVAITHFFLVGLVERNWRILVKSYRIKRKKDDRVVDHKLLVAMNLDAALLQMILAFTEDAPQLVLQLYVLVSRRYVDTLQATNIQDLWTMLSICFSFISYSRAVVNYISCLRDSKRHKGQLRWYGYLSMWLWRAFMIISRILALVFFATEFKLWFFLALLIHFFIVLAFLSRHEVYFFPGHKWQQHFVRALMSYIHLFCFFCLEGVRTISWAVKYYILTFIEILIFSLLWFTNETRLLPLRVEMAGFIVIYLFFSFGLIMMSIYYRFLHPRFKEARFSLSAPLKSELADRDPNERADENQEQIFELWI